MAGLQGWVLVTGATGHQGGAVAHALLSRKHKVKVMTRKPESDAANQLARLGAEVVKGDLDDAASLERALDGAWGTFAVQNTWEAGVEREEEQGKRFAEVARKKGVQHFVYTSVASAHRKTGIPHFENKFRIEEKVRSLKFPSYVILRPTFFMENWLGPWFKPAIDQGKLMIAIKPTTKLQMIAVDDIGTFGLQAFEEAEKLNRREIDIAGDSRTMPETAEILGRALGRRIEFAPPPIDEVRKMSADYAMMLEWFDRVGYDVDIANLQKEYGVSLMSLEPWANKVVASVGSR